MKNLKKQNCVKIVASVFTTIVLLMSFSCTPCTIDDEGNTKIENEKQATTGEDKGQETKDDED